MKKNIWIASIVGVVVLTVALCFVLKRSGSSEIMRMAKSGATETEMLAAVEKSPNERLNADQVIALKQAGVPDSVIITMLRKNPAPSAAGGVAKK